MSVEWVESAAEEESPAYAWKSADGSGLCWLSLAIGDPDDPAPEGSSDFAASTGSEDRYGDYVEQREWRLANYRKNPVILLEHGFGPQGRIVIGRADRTQITKVGDTHQLRQRVRWDAGEHNPIATLVARQHATGFRNAVSVGFRPQKSVNRTELDATDPRYVDPTKQSRWSAGYVHRFPELYETSSVAVPGNAEALGLSADLANAENTDAKLRTVAGEWLTRAQRDSLLSYIRQDSEVRRAIALAALNVNKSSAPTGVSWVKGE